MMSACSGLSLKSRCCWYFVSSKVGSIWLLGKKPCVLLAIKEGEPVVTNIQIELYSLSLSLSLTPSFRFVDYRPLGREKYWV